MGDTLPKARPVLLFGGQMEQPPDEVQFGNSNISTRIALGMERAIGGLPPPPPELGWIAILGVAISLISIFKKR